MSEKRAAPVRAVIDSNLFVRVLLGSQFARPIYEAFAAGEFQLVTSESLLAELVEVLARPKFHRVIAEAEARLLLELIADRADIVEPSNHQPECRDPDDEIFLSTALGGQAQFLATADADLLEDERLMAEMLALGVEIVDATGFLTRLRANT